MAVVHLAKGRQKRVTAGHPWVFQTEVEEIKGHFVPGDIVDVVDHRGKFLGRGYCNPASQIIVRIMTYREETIDAAFIRRRVEEAWEYRKRLLPDLSSCRVIFGEADLLPALIVDKFGDYLVLQTLALGIDRWKKEIVEILDDLLRPRGIFERNDVPVRELEGLEQRKGYLKGRFDPRIEIAENGLRLAVDVENGQKTGYFLDQRENRAAIRPLVKGARVLDAFCHTGSFSLNAAQGGAKEVLGLDVSEAAVAQAEDNARLNGLQDLCRFRVVNAFDELRAMDHRREQFDVIILDPPAFAKNRASLEGAVRGYKEINLRAMRLLPERGYLVTCSCSYHLPEDLLLEILKDAARDTGRRLRLIESRTQAKDHPILLGAGETHYLKCLILEVTGLQGVPGRV